MIRHHSHPKASLSQKILKNVVWNFTGNGFVLAISIIATPYIVHSLAIDLYGIYALIGVVIGYFSFLQLGLATASVKYISQHFSDNDEEGVRMMFWSCLAAYIVIGLIGMCAIAASSQFLVDRFFKMPEEFKPIAITAFRLGSIGFFVSTILGPISGIIQALGRFDILNKVGAVLGTLQIILTVLFLKLGLSLSAIIISNIAVQASGVIVYWIFARRLVPYLAKPLIKRGAIGRLFKFGGFVTVSSIVSPILTNIEKIFLSSIYSVASLTYYSVPFALVAKLSIIPATLSSVIFPAFSSLQAIGEEDMNKDLSYRSTLYLCFPYAFFVLFFLFFGKSFIGVWMGNEFAQKSSGILMVLSVAGLVNALALPSFTALQGLGKPHLPAIFHVAELMVYIPVSYFCILKFGALGAAIAWFLRVSLDTILLNKALTGMFKISIWDWYGRILQRALPPVLVASGLFLALKKCGLYILSPMNIGGLAVIFAVYVFSVWVWGFDSFARNNMKTLIAGLVR